MHPVRAGQGKGKNSGDVGKDDALDDTFGKEGTNKTQPVPDPAAKPSDVPSGGKHIEPSPYTRG